MYIIIVGAGEVGTHLAYTFVADGHDVVIIEKNDAKASRIDGSLDAMVIQGNGVSRATLIEAGVRHSDLFIAATPVDEVNLVSCIVAQKTGNHTLRTIARVKEIELYKNNGVQARDLGLSLLIGPEESVVDQIDRQILFPGSGEIRSLADGQLALLELPLDKDSLLVKKPISQLREDLPAPSLIVGVYGDHGFTIPDGSYTLKPGERVDVMTLSSEIKPLLRWSSNKQKQAKHVLILGAGATAVRVAATLESFKLSCTLVEAESKNCEEAAQKLTKAIVVHGDPSQPSFLKEQLAQNSDTVLVDMGDDEKNVLLGLFAKQLGAKKVIVLSNELAYAPLAHRMGIDAVVSPRRAIAKEILQFVRHSDAQFVLGDHQGEVIELQVPRQPKNKNLIQSPLQKLNIPNGVILGAVMRDDVVFIPNGKTILSEGDRIYVFALRETVPTVEKLFEA